MAINFNGTTQYLERTTGVPTNGAVTMCGWFRFSATPSMYDQLISIGRNDSGVSLSVGYIGGAGPWNVNNVTGTTGSLGTTPASGQAVFVAMTIRGTGTDEVTGFSRFAGATAFETNVCDGQAGTFTHMRVGDSTWDGTDYFPGAAWNIKVWDRVLTQAELWVESFYKRVMYPASLHCHWPLRDSSDLYDYSGNGRNPTAVGSPTSADDSHGLWVPRRKIFLPSGGADGVIAMPWMAV